MEFFASVCVVPLTNILDVASVAHLRVLGGTKSILDSNTLSVLVGEVRQLLRHVNVANILRVALSEAQINFFRRSWGSLQLEEVDDGQEARVNASKEDIGSFPSRFWRS